MNAGAGAAFLAVFAAGLAFAVASAAPAAPKVKEQAISAATAGALRNKKVDDMKGTFRRQRIGADCAAAWGRWSGAYRPLRGRREMRHDRSAARCARAATTGFASAEAGLDEMPDAILLLLELLQ